MLAEDSRYLASTREGSQGVNVLTDFICAIGNVDSAFLGYGVQLPSAELGGKTAAGARAGCLPRKKQSGFPTNG